MHVEVSLIPWREVIQMPDTAFASAADAAGMLDASLDHLAATDWASLGTQAHGEMLAQLQRAQAEADRGQRRGTGRVHRAVRV